MYTIEIIGLNKLLDLASKYPAISQKYVNKAISTSLVRVLGEEKQQAPVNTGRLRDGWQITLGPFEGALRSNVSYAAAVNNGTIPHMPPVSALDGWARKRGISPWALAMSMKQKGTKANPFWTRTLMNQTAKVNAEFKIAISGILLEISR